MVYQQLIRSAVVLVFLFSAGSVFAQDEELQQLYQEYMQINQRLQELQQRALMDEAVAEKAEEYSDFVDAKLRELDPRAAELVQKREETIDKMQIAQEEGDFESIQELQYEYQEISQELQPYLQRAMQDEEVQRRQQEIEEVLIAKMEEIDPETIPLLNRMMELSEKIDRKIRE